MAVIAEDDIFTVDVEVADHMVDIGLLFKCPHTHTGINSDEWPVYHIHIDAPKWFGFNTIPMAIWICERNLIEQKAKVSS